MNSQIQLPGFQQLQPIPNNVTSTETAYAVQAPHAQPDPNIIANLKPRYTRAERRAFTQEKRALQASSSSRKGHLKQKPHQAEWDALMQSLPKDIRIDDMIAFLLEKRAKAGNGSHTLRQATKSLASRITKASVVATPEKKSKVPSAKKLEKTAKRKEIREERNKAKRAAKAAASTQRPSQDQAATTGPAQQLDALPQVEKVEKQSFEEEITYE